MPASRFPVLPERPLRVAVLIFPGFPMMAFGAVVEPLRAANAIAGRELYAWQTVSASSAPVMASNGAALAPDATVQDDPFADRIVVCTGGDAENLESREALAWLRRRLRAGGSVGAVADAAFFLARGGLLDGYACTLHWSSQPAFREAFPEVDLRHDLYVIDRNRFTSAGGIGSLDMMLEIIRTDFGPELSDGVAEWFVHSPLRSSVDRRMMPLRLRTGIRDELVLSAIAVMEDNVEERLRMPDLAEQLSVSADRLERAFADAVGMAPVAYYRRLRLRRARDLLAHSTLPVRDIALACGYSSMSSFARAFRELNGIAPSAVRRH